MQTRQRHYPQESQWWSDWLTGKDEQARLNIIERYLPLARSIAHSIYVHQFRDGVEFNDYYQYALVGLLEALQRFDPTAEIAFSTFATYRIRGAVLNGLAGLTEQRSRTHARLLKERTASLRNHQSQRDEFAAIVEITVGLAIGFFLEEEECNQDNPRVQDPYHQHQKSQLGATLRAMVQNLPEREKRIIQYHYFHAVPFEQIATIMGLTTGRVSQLHHGALERLRDKNKKQKRGLDESY